MEKIDVVLILSIAICLLIIIPASFAEDNQTLSVEEDVSDYYFDVNASVDGDGMKESPFRDFTDDRVKDDSTIHLAEGEYGFENSRQFTNISFCGENPQTTILNGRGTTLTVEGMVSFNNLTLTNFKINNTGDLTAFNTVFTKMIPSETKKGNTWGAAIYAGENKNIYLENCTFFDNEAEYGGALYVSGGDLIILNSLFYDNIAYNFGGAIACGSNVGVTINNTRFLNVKSRDDAGGAIYLVSSSLNACNLTVVNASSTFGSAITALDSLVDLKDCVFENNTASYDGGAIYAMYGSINLVSSRFIANSARNGGGLFIDDVDVFDITDNDFAENAAADYGGAIYCLLKNDMDLTANNFSNNTANCSNDIHDTSRISLKIGNGNYTLYVYNQTYDSEIPDKYDLRDYGYVTVPKNQLDSGNCWAFAALASLESCILKASGDVLDFSEENMKNLMSFYSDYGFKNRMTNVGGTHDMAIAYLASWLGPVNESDDIFDDKSHLSSVLDSMVHVQNVLYLKRDNFTDNDAIKSAILKYGAVATSMRYDSNSIRLYSGVAFHYYTGSEGTNHAVTIVGWDDTLTLKGKTGAWLVKNSWGPNWANDGYFYVSYYDTVFAKPGTYSSYTFILNDTQKFDKNYHYEVSGPTDYFYYAQNSLWYENAFYADDNEFLSGVSTFFNQDTDWEFYIYVNSKLKLTQNGSATKGYFTFNFDYPIPLVKGDLFEVLFKITTEGDAGAPISKASVLTKKTYVNGTSFISRDGYNFDDLYDLVSYYPGHSYLSQVACIKAFTQLVILNPAIKNLNIFYDSLDLYNIVLSLLDENNNTVKNGEVTFRINGDNFTVDVSNGFAFLQLPLSLGINNISWSYSSPNYFSCNGSTTFEVLPIKLQMNITVCLDSNNAHVNFTFSQPINETIAVSINEDNMTVKSVNGCAVLDLDDLDYGSYDIVASVLKDVYDSRNSTVFLVNTKRTYLNASGMTTFYNSGDVYSVVLLDQFNHPVVGREVRFEIGSNVYYNFTDENGTAAVAIRLKDSTYNASIVFEGDESYLKSQNDSQIIVKSTVILPEIRDYTLNSDYEVFLLDKKGDALNNTLVTFKINAKEYDVSTDANGKATFVIPLKYGSYDIYVTNPQTGQISSQNIDIAKRITQNKDMTFYYGSKSGYIIRVCADNGEFVKDLEVQITLNKKVYKEKSDKNGYVTFKLNLKSGTYKITASYKGFSVTNKIKVKPTLITKNKSVKKGKKITYQAKLLNSKGKPFKGKKITFKFKGKTYKAKTNKKGIAKITIKKSLKVGKYKITAKYQKQSSTSKIIIKK